MNFSYIDDPEWGKLDNETQQKVIGLAFQDNIASDAEWTNLSPGIQKSVQDLYLKDATEYSRSVMPKPGDDDSWNVTRGLKAGALQTAAVVPAVGAMAAKTVGLDSAAESMMGAAQGLMKKSEKYQPDTSFKELVDDPSIEGAADWAMYTIGNFAPSLVVGFGGAATGAKITTKIFLKNAIKKGVSKGLTAEAAAKAVTEQAIKKATLRGAQVGIVGSTAPLEGGHMFMEDVESHGIEDASVGKSVLMGGLAGMVELGVGGFGKGHMRLIEKFMGTAAKETAEQSPKLAVRMLKEIGRQSGGEAFQELTQEELAILNEAWTATPDEEYDTTSKENLMRLAESAAGGGLIGIPGGMAGGIGGPEKEVINLPDVDPTAEQPDIPPVKDWEFGKVGDSFKKGMEAAAALKATQAPRVEPEGYRPAKESAKVFEETLSAEERLRQSEVGRESLKKQYTEEVAAGGREAVAKEYKGKPVTGEIMTPDELSVTRELMRDELRQSGEERGRETRASAAGKALEKVGPVEAERLLKEDVRTRQYFGQGFLTNDRAKQLNEIITQNDITSMAGTPNGLVQVGESRAMGVPEKGTIPDDKGTVTPISPPLTPDKPPITDVKKAVATKGRAPESAEIPQKEPATLPEPKAGAAEKAFLKAGGKKPKDLYEAEIAEEDGKTTAEGGEYAKDVVSHAKQEEARTEFYESAAKEGHSAQAHDIIGGNIDRLLDDVRRGRITNEKAVAMHEDAVKNGIAIPEKLEQLKKRIKPKKAEAPEGKEPWEMSAEEFKNRVIEEDNLKTGPLSLKRGGHISLEPQVEKAVKQFHEWGIRTRSSAGYQHDVIRPGAPTGYTGITFENGKIPQEAIAKIKKEYPDVEITDNKINFLYDFLGGIGDVNKPKNVKPQVEKWDSILKIIEPYVSHRQITEQAIKEGKIKSHPDYPDLGKQVEKPKETKKAKAPEPKKKRVSKGPTTIRGTIKAMGFINFLNMKGEVKDMPFGARILTRANSGVPYDLAEKSLKAEGWMYENESLIELLPSEEFRKRRHLTVDTLERKDNLTGTEKQFKEDLEHEPESPPEGNYVQMNAEDLPEGKKLTIIEGNSADGWDTYEVTEKDPFGVTLKDGTIIELSPLDQVDVLMDDVKDVPGVAESQTKMFGPDPGQLDMFGGAPKQAKAKRTRKKKTPTVRKEAQIDLFTGKAKQIQKDLFKPFPKKPPILTKAPASNRAKGLSPGTFMHTSGHIRGPSTTVKSVDEVASLLAHIRKDNQENLFAITTDKDGKILEIHQYSRGTKSESNVHSIEVAGHVLNIPDAHTVYVAHNHPSGDSSPSQPDLSLMEVIGEIVELKGIKFEAFIIAGNGYRRFDGEKYAKEMMRRSGLSEVNFQALGKENEDERDFKAEKYTNKPHTKLTPVSRTKRMPIKKRGMHPKRISGESITNPDEIVNLVKSKYGGEDGFVFLGSKLNVVGFLPFPSGMPIKEAAAKFIQAAENANAAGSVLSVNDPLASKPGRIGFVSAIAQNLNSTLKLFDIIENGNSYATSGRLGLMTTGPTPFNNLYSKNALYSVNPGNPLTGLTRDHLKKIFHWADSVRTLKDGSTLITKGTRQFKIARVDHIAIDKAAFEIAYRRKPTSADVAAGAYQDGTITLSDIADAGTVAHESYHYLRASGLVNNADVRAIHRVIGKDATEEQEAEWIEKNINDRNQKGRLGKLIQKIRDFVDSIVNLFHRTATGVVRDIESGKAFTDKQSPVFEFAQAVSYSLAQAKRNILDNPAFVKWFGDSKVVDDAGKPLVVYHGTRASFSKFDPKIKREDSDQGWLGSNMIYFSENPDVANAYSDSATTKEDETSFGGKTFSKDARVIPVYLSVQKIYRFPDNRDIPINKEEADAFREEMLSKGYDGVYLPYVFYGKEEVKFNEVAVFNPTQIKSIYNKGTFDPANPDIRYQAKSKALREGMPAYSLPKTETPEGGKNRAGVLYEKGEVPDGSFVHGRVGKQSLRDDVVILGTNDWEVAEQYAGDNGSMWLLEPSTTSKVLDADKNYFKIVDALFADYKKGALPYELEKTIEYEIKEYGLSGTKEKIAMEIVPEDIVGDAGMWDSIDFVEWVVDRFEYDIVVWNEGESAAIINKNNIKTQKVNKGAPKYSVAQKAAEKRYTKVLNEAAGDHKAPKDGEKSKALREGMPAYSLKEYDGSLPETTVDKAKKALERPFNDTMAWLVDKNRPISTVQSHLEKVTDEIDVFLKETQRPKRTAAKVKKAWNEEVKPIITKMAQFKINIQDLETYKHALHAHEANAALRRANAKIQVGKIVKVLDASNEEKKASAINESVKDLEKPEEWYTALNDIIDTYADEESLENTLAKWKIFSEKPSGMTDIEATEILKEYKGDKNIEELGVMLDAINDNKLELLFNSGLLPQQEYEAVKNKYENYVPLYREGFDDSLFGTSRGLKPSGRQIKVRGGSTRTVVNILAHSIANYEKAINASEKAISQRALLGLVQANPESDVITVEPVKKSPRHDKDGNLRMYPNLADVQKNEVRLMVDGKQYLLAVQRDNKDAMLMMKTLKAESETSGPVVNALAKFNRFLAKINTTWSPEFIISNFARDFGTANINIKDTGVKGKGMFKGAKDAWGAIFAIERGKPKGTKLEGYYKRFMAAGGKIGWSDVHDSAESLTKKITSELEMESGKRPVRKTVQGWLQLIEDANTSIENGIRLHVFKLSVDQGKTDERAAQIASDLTVDFTKKGTAGPVINSLYLFANAGIQGSYRVLRAATKSRAVQKTLAGVFTAGFTVGMLNAIAGGDDEDGEAYINKIDGFIKDRNAVFVIPGTKGRSAKIPLPWGYNTVWNMGTEAARAFTEENFSPLESAGRLARSFANAFNPVASGTLLQTLAPTVADPFVQIAENKNWFGGELMPGVNKFDKTPSPDSQRYWRSASVGSKWITEQLNSITGGDKIKPGAIDVSPETLDLMVDTLGGSALRFVKDSLSLPLKVVRKEEIKMHKIPFVRRVAGDQPEWANSRIFHENIEEVLITKERLKAYRGTPAYKKISIAMRAERSLIPLAEASEKRLKALRKRRKRAMALQNKQMIERIEALMSRVYINFNKRYNQRIKEN